MQDHASKREPPARDGEQRRLLLLTTTTGYQTRAFREAAAKLGMSLLFGTDRCHVLDDPWQDGALALHFSNPEYSAEKIADLARTEPFDGIVALGDCTPSTAARAAQALGLLHHPPEAADICRDKYRSRQRLAAQGLNVPAFIRFQLEADPREILRLEVLPFGFPCVLKPLALSASRGVIRTDNAEEFIRAFERIGVMLRSPEIQVLRE